MAVHLDPARRQGRVEALRQRLTAASPGSRVSLRGSLATGKADIYADIDLAWHVAAARFGAACDELTTTLASIDVVADVRWDPQEAAPRRRLAFVRFAGDPLFWRVDLEILATGDSPLCAPQPIDVPWSRTHSALMGAVAAIKACLRDEPATAAKLVSRGFEKIHIPVPDGPVPAQILALVDTIYDADDTWALLAADVRSLHRSAFDHGSAATRGVPRAGGDHATT